MEHFGFPQDAVPEAGFFRLRRNRLRAPARPMSQARNFHLARHALFHAAGLLGLAAGDHLLLPAYVCKAAVQPFLARGIQCDFYRLHADCSPDLEDIEGRLGPRTRGLLVVHYFGFPQPLRALRRFCDERQLLLIEDCAHVLQGTADDLPLGAAGDVSVFSWRKFLPLSDGATLFTHREATHHPLSPQRQGLSHELRMAFNALQAAASHPDSILCRGLYHMASGLRGAAAAGEHQTAVLPEGIQRKPVPPVGDIHGADFVGDGQHRAMSRVSSLLLAHADIARVAETRRRNYGLLADGLRKVSGARLLHRDIGDTVCPWILPCFLDGVPQALVELRRRGMPVVGWGGVRPALPAGQHPEAGRLYDELLFLPVHQSLREQDMAVLLQAIGSL